MKKYILLTILPMILSVLPLQGQVDHGYLIDKYWYYRERLKYFVIPGTDGSQRGEGMVAAIRNKQSTGVISYGDQMVHFGYYLGVLATEYALLTYYGQDATSTLDELNIALDCYVRDDACEANAPWFKDFSSYDGFHMRQDVPSTFIQDHPQLNTDLTPADNVAAMDPGSPAWVEYVSANDHLQWDVNPGGTPYQYYQSTEEMKFGSMSQDNAIGLIKGLALVVKCIPEGYYAHDKAAEIAGKVISRIWGGGSWIIVDPNMEPVPRGSNAFFYALPLTVINMAMGNPMLPSGPNAGNANISWQTLQYAGTVAENNCMTLTMAALCDCWNGSLSGQAWFNTTGGCIYHLSNQDNWDTFYLLLWEYLHDKTSPSLSLNKVADQLMAAPCNGPYCYDSAGHQHSPDGWASTYKFEQAAGYQNHGKTGSQGNYNGLDYMLLYNLYHLVNIRDGQQPIPFMNLINRQLSGALPTCSYVAYVPMSITYGDNARNAIYDAFKTITSVQVVDTLLHPRNTWSGPEDNCPGIGSYDAGHVTYRAGQTINLLPGFHARQGVYFHAYIDPYDCDHLRSEETGNPYNFHNDEDPTDQQPGFTGNPWPADEMLSGYLNETFANSPEESAPEPIAYPNPFTDRTTFYLVPPSSGNAVCQLFDIHGTVLLQTEKAAEKDIPLIFEIPGGKLTPGTYCCVITLGGQTYRLTLVKQASAP